jgi:hypothetical protein
LKHSVNSTYSANRSATKCRLRSSANSRAQAPHSRWPAHPKFCYAVNNYIYPEWCAYQIGRTLVEIKTEAERRADAAEKRAADAELKVKTLLETFQVRAA